MVKSAPMRYRMREVLNGFQSAAMEESSAMAAIKRAASQKAMDLAGVLGSDKIGHA